MALLARRNRAAAAPKTRVEDIQPALPAKSVYLLSPGDVHLAGENRGGALHEILSETDVDVLVLNGDFLDVASLNHLLWRLTKADRRLIRLIDEKRAKGMRVVYTLGNHDEDIEKLLDEVEAMQAREKFPRGSRGYDVLETLSLIGNWELMSTFVHEYRGATFVHAHGDQWDYIVRGRFLGRLAAHIGSRLWEFLKQVDNEKHRIAMFVKRRTKVWTKVSDHVEHGIVNLARRHGARYAFAGHTHDLRESSHEDVEYINHGSFDMYEAGLLSIAKDGAVQLHRVYARHTPIRKR